MTSTAAAPLRRSQPAHTHAHLWLLPDGTGLHAPYGLVGDRIRHRSDLLPPVRALVCLARRARSQARAHGRVLPGGDGTVP